MQIETDRLILRTIKQTDADDIFEYSKEENVGPNAGWQPHKNIDETKEIMEMIFTDKDGVFGIVDKETNKVIGSLGLIDDPKRENPQVRMLGYALSEKYWGKGLMTEAAKEVLRYGFEEMKLNMISAYCYPENQRSRSVLIKCGFEYEGTLKDCEVLFNGTVKDNCCFHLYNK